MRGFNRLEEPGGGAGLRRTGAGGAGFSDRVGVGGREVPLMTPMGDGNTCGRGPVFGCKGDKRTGPGGRDAGTTGVPAGEADTMSGAGNTGGTGPRVGWAETSGPGGGRTGTGPRGARGLFTTTTVRPSCLGTGCSILLTFILTGLGRGGGSGAVAISNSMRRDRRWRGRNVSASYRETRPSRPIRSNRPMSILWSG